MLADCEVSKMYVEVTLQINFGGEEDGGKRLHTFFQRNLMLHFKKLFFKNS